jgi:hypothetical protein
MVYMVDPYRTHTETVFALSEHISFHEKLTHKIPFLVRAPFRDTNEYSTA